MELQSHGPSPTRILSTKQLSQLINLSESTLWRMRQRGQLPQPIRVSPGRVGWRESDIVAWLATRETVGETAGE